VRIVQCGGAQGRARVATSCPRLATSSNRANCDAGPTRFFHFLSPLICVMSSSELSVYVEWTMARSNPHASWPAQPPLFSPRGGPQPTCALGVPRCVARVGVRAYSNNVRIRGPNEPRSPGEQHAHSFSPSGSRMHEVEFDLATFVCGVATVPRIAGHPQCADTLPRR
jgi:hypothetical protein